MPDSVVVTLVFIESLCLGSVKACKLELMVP